MSDLIPVSPSRRRLLGLIAVAPVAVVAACSTPIGTLSPEEGVRRLLTLSSQAAFARLIQPGGFYDDQLTRLTVPDAANGRGGAVLAAVLRTDAVQRRIAIAVNDVAVDAADRATPLVMDAISRMTFSDALAILRGGGSPATDLLRRETGGALVDAMFPEISAGLRGDAFEILTAALGARSGFDLGGIATSLSRQASDSIFRAIGREEAAFRADPRRTRDPLLIALLSGGRF
ncbi:DUF4197 domain-containing protein [Sphingomonas sp. Y38-1Y]|uniref:DUF4197 domain-containing protein n=1 Tax=Sphingomonas sp. Y38-1Y TaxID=3078265 RepID=UPI0028EB5E3D|nr:DUF4197 domain-containing protein [Sphingomonas sp. Y38-1Y]